MFFRSKADTEARDKQRAETLRIEDGKLETQLQGDMSRSDRAERYLALSDFAEQMDGRLNALRQELDKKKHRLQRNISLAGCAPFAAVAAALMPFTATLAGVLAFTGVVAFMARIGYILVAQQMGNFDVGNKRLMHDMSGDFQLADKYRRLAGTQMEMQEKGDLLALATSPKSELITKKRPALKDAMLAALRRIAPKPEMPETPDALPPSVETDAAITVRGPLTLKTRAPT